MHAAGAFFGTDKMDFSVVRIIAGVPDGDARLHALH